MEMVCSLRNMFAQLCWQIEFGIKFSRGISKTCAEEGSEFACTLVVLSGQVRTWTLCCGSVTKLTSYSTGVMYL